MADLPNASPIDARVIDYARGSGRNSKWGRGFLACAATFLFPGLGHLIAGRSKRAGFWLLTAIASQAVIIQLIIPRFIFFALVAAAIVVVLMLSMYVDAFLCARQSRHLMLGKPWRRYSVGTLMFLGGVFVFNPWGSISMIVAREVMARYVRTYSIGSASMNPALVAGDRILSHKDVPFPRWSIVTYLLPHDPSVTVVSRIVGLPGDTIEIRNDGLYINGQMTAIPSGAGPYSKCAYQGVKDPSLTGRPGAGCEGNPIYLAADEYYLLGDNSPRALDSRYWEISIEGHQLGAIPRSGIIGRVSAIYWPPNRWKMFD